MWFICQFYLLKFLRVYKNMFPSWQRQQTGDNPHLETHVEHFQYWIFTLVFVTGALWAAWIKTVYYESYFGIFHKKWI